MGEAFHKAWANDVDESHCNSDLQVFCLPCVEIMIDSKVQKHHVHSGTFQVRELFWPNKKKLNCTITLLLFREFPTEISRPGGCLVVRVRARKAPPNPSNAIQPWHQGMNQNATPTPCVSPPSVCQCPLPADDVHETQMCESATEEGPLHPTGGFWKRTLAVS